MQFEQQVTFGIITFNVRDKLSKCIESLVRFFPAAKIVVLDNASEDGSQAAITARFPQVEYHYNDENTYFASGCNQLLGYCETPFMLLMNADIFITDRSVEELVRFAQEHDRYVGVSPSVMDNGLHRHMASGLLTPGICVARDTVLGKGLRKTAWYRRHMFEDKQPGDTFDVPKITNSCCLLRCDLFKQIGQFDPDQILYWTEEALALRVARAGLAQAVLGSVVVQHEHGSSTKKLPPDLVRAIHVRDRFVYMCNHYGRLRACGVELLILLRPKIWCSIRDLYYVWKNRKQIRAVRSLIRSSESD